MKGVKAGQARASRVTVGASPASGGSAGEEMSPPVGWWPLTCTWAGLDSVAAGLERSAGDMLMLSDELRSGKKRAKREVG